MCWTWILDSSPCPCHAARCDAMRCVCTTLFFFSFVSCLLKPPLAAQQRAPRQTAFSRACSVQTQVQANVVERGRSVVCMACFFSPVPALLFAGEGPPHSARRPMSNGDCLSSEICSSLVVRRESMRVTDGRLMVYIRYRSDQPSTWASTRLAFALDGRCLPGANALSWRASFFLKKNHFRFITRLGNDRQAISLWLGTNLCIGKTQAKCHLGSLGSPRVQRGRGRAGKRPKGESIRQAPPLRPSPLPLVGIVAGSHMSLWSLDSRGFTPELNGPPPPASMASRQQHPSRLSRR